MKFVFFGTPYVARDTLQFLLDNDYCPELVVSNPDAPRGRGQVLTPSETKVLAMNHNLPVYTPDKLDENAIDEIKKYNCDYAIVVAYGKILPQKLLDIFPKGIFNIHYSLLPKYRGAAPVETALLNNDTKTGVTIQKMVYQMDAGDIVAQTEEIIKPDDTTITLKPRLISLGNKLLLEQLSNIESGHISLRPQSEADVTFAPKLNKEDSLLDLTADDSQNWSKYRAFIEWSGTYFFEDGKRMKIKKAKYENDRFIIERVIPEGGKERDYL